MTMKRLVTAAVLVVVLGMVAIAQRGSADSPVVGVWRVSEGTFTGPNARTVKNPQPGIVIFTPRYYSINAVTSDTPRPEMTRDVPLSASEKMSGASTEYAARTPPVARSIRRKSRRSLPSWS